GVAHVDCRRPRNLTHDERSILYGYCWAHPITCPACSQSFRLFELDSDPFERHNRTACPHCRTDVINSVRDHLYTCPLCPEVLRRRAREARENARMLVKDAKALRDRADVLIREAEVAAAESREAVKQSAAEGLRRLIQTKLRDGTLPRHETSEIVAGHPG